MVQINFASREVSCKIVYYGPGRCGKTTNLQVVHAKAPPTSTGEMVSIATKGDRTLYFDFLSLDLGTVAGMRTRFHLYTVPGQVYYDQTRKLVLQGSDGIVFVADSAREMMKENIESLDNLAKNLHENGLDIKDIPLVLQWNKRDLPGAMPVDELEKVLNRHSWPAFEATAVKGDGVFQTLKGIAQQVIRKLNREQGYSDDGHTRKAEPSFSVAPPPPPPPPPSAAASRPVVGTSARPAASAPPPVSAPQAPRSPIAPPSVPKSAPSGGPPAAPAAQRLPSIQPRSAPPPAAKPAAPRIAPPPPGAAARTPAQPAPTPQSQARPPVQAAKAAPLPPKPVQTPITAPKPAQAPALKPSPVPAAATAPRPPSMMQAPKQAAIAPPKPVAPAPAPPPPPPVQPSPTATPIPAPASKPGSSPAPRTAVKTYKVKRYPPDPEDMEQGEAVAAPSATPVPPVLAPDPIPAAPPAPAAPKSSGSLKSILLLLGLLALAGAVIAAYQYLKGSR
jgi:signal recognition particle receptor subunit beta